MRILLLRTWLRNIGNGVIEKGCHMALERAFPDAEIYETSGYPFVSADLKERGELDEIFKLTGALGRRLGRRVCEGKGFRDNVYEVGASLADIDLVVLPGCVLYEFAIRPYRELIEKLRRRDVPVLLLGVGGGDYDESTVRYVSEWLHEVDPAGIITRDSQAFACYADSVDNAYNGIDCGFFIDDWYNPPDSRDSFKAATFDKTDEPDIDATLTVRPDHNPFGDSRPYQSLLRTLKNRLFRQSEFRDENVLVSDMIEDYLYVYANAEETHADRIHACVPALAYGNKAKFYIETPRDHLFENVLDDDIGEELVELRTERMESKKEEQVEMIREFV